MGGAITEATGVTRAKLRDMFNRLGDLGDVAQACRHKQVAPDCFCSAQTPHTLLQGCLRKHQQTSESAAALERIAPYQAPRSMLY